MEIENGDVLPSIRNRILSPSPSKPVYVNTKVDPTGLFSSTFTVFGSNSDGKHFGLIDSPV